MDPKKANKKKRAKNNKNQDADDEEIINVDTEKLKEELEGFLKINQEAAKAKDKESEITNKIKEKTTEKMVELKDLKNKSDYEKLYQEAIEIIKKASQYEIDSSISKLNNDFLKKENTSLVENNNLLKNKNSEQEKLNKMLLDKIKNNTEEKKKILEDEAQKRQEMVEKCENFMKEVQSKFEGSLPEKEELIKENENLRQKLEQASKFIQENMNSEFVQKAQRMEEEFKELLNNRVKEVSQQATDLMTENAQLKGQINLYSSKFEEFNKSIQSYNKIYETLKKEIEKVGF